MTTTATNCWLICTVLLTSSAPFACCAFAADLQPETQALQPETQAQPGAPLNQPNTNESQLPNASEAQQAPLSDAERIAELKESLEEDRKQLQSLEIEFSNPNSEYAVAEREFRALNEKLDAKRKELQEARSKMLAPRVVAALYNEADSIQKLWGLAKDRFDLAIEDRKTLKEQSTTLRSKIERDEKALLDLTEGPKPTDSNPADSAPSTTPAPGTTSEAAASGTAAATNKDSADKQDSKNTDNKEPEKAEEEEDEELVLAKEEAERKESEAEKAAEETQSLEARLKDLQQLIVQEQKELNLGRKKMDLASSAQHELNAELTRRQEEKADFQELQSLRSAIQQANQRFLQARSEVTEINERLNDHRAELAGLQSEHIFALQEAAQKKQAAEDAVERVAELRNPYTLRNILQWMIEHGPRLLLIIAGMFVLNRAASLFAARSVQLVSKGSNRGSKAERENRAKTLVGVFQNAATVGIFISGSMMILEELGANITVLMGGVAVIGLAVAFGAQNLIKDYFYGFVMLLENQYMLNDTVRIGGVTGQVERITLRMTVLRDGGGVVHFIPNGTINSVSNETHGWSRANCEIGIHHQEDFEHVAELLRSVSNSLVNDSEIGPLLLEAPSEPGIEGLSGPTVLVKMSVKTAPNKQGAVKQEWLRRVKRCFQENGIAPPIPITIDSKTSAAPKPLEINPLDRKAG